MAKKKAITKQIKFNNKTCFAYNDNAGPYLKYMLEKKPELINTALASLGWFLRKEMVRYMESGSNWKPLSEIQEKRTFTINSSLSGRSARYIYSEGLGKFYGRLGRAIRYKRNKRKMSLKIGFLNSSASRIAALLQKGNKTKVTPKMRRLFFASGYIPPKDYVILPPRDMVTPVYERYKFDFNTYIEKKLMHYESKEMWWK